MSHVAVVGQCASRHPHRMRLKELYGIPYMQGATLGKTTDCGITHVI